MKKILIKLNKWADEALMQTYVQSDGIMYRIFLPIEHESDWDESKVMSEPQLWTNDKTKGLFYEHEGIKYVCSYSRFCVINESIVKPYRDIFACNAQLCMGSHLWSDRMFFADRLGETYYSKFLAGAWGKHLKIFGGRWLYRWIIQPNTDLTDAPVICLQNRRLITNIKFDETYTIYELTPENNDKGAELKQYEYLAALYITNDVDPEHKVIRWQDVTHPWAESCRPVIKIEGPDTIPANGTADFTVKAYHLDGTPNTDTNTYLIECKQGYAPSKELRIVNGVGTTRIMALGLKDGETLRFKVNDAVWTGYAEKTLNVVSAE